MKVASWMALRASGSNVGTILGRAARYAGVLPLCLAYLVLTACGGGSGTPAPTLQSIQVTGSASAAAGTSAQLTATAIYSDNSHQDVTASASWSSSNTSIATVNAGKVSAVQVGSAQISASLNGVSANLSFTVSQATLTSLQVTPATPSLAKGMTLQLTATGVFSDGSTQNLTSQVSWASANSAIASVSNASGSLGLGTGVSVGSTAVTATSGSVSGSATLTVTAAVLESIQVTPAAASLAAGVTQQLKATGIFSDQSTQDLTAQVSWVSSTTAIATVGTGASSPGLVKADSVGTATISAASGSISGSAALTVTAATLVSIQVTPPTPSIAAGTTQQLTATGTYSDNSTQSLTSSVTWMSSNAGVATISNAAASNGLASAAATGTTSITAASGAVTSPAVTLTVTPAVLVSIQITPPAPSIALGTTQQLTATGTYSDNSTQNLTSTVTWVSSNPGAATISNAAGSNGLATSATMGTANISATSGGVTSSAVTLTVTPAVLVSIEVTPPAPSIAAGTTQQFTATGTYSDNSTQNLTAIVTWSSSNMGVATISNVAGSNGLAGSAATGTTTITATSGAATSPAVTLTVTPAVLVSIQVTPPAPSIALGTTQQLTATGRYSDNSTQNLTSSVTWMSSNTGVATISNAVGSNGLATSATTGTAGITATSGAVTSPAATLTVTPAVLTAIQVTPSTPSVAAGYTQQFTATGVYSDTSTQNLTASVTWSSSNPVVATISNAAGSNGLATSAITGTANISATSGAVTSPAVTLTVTPAVLVSIQVTPRNPSTFVGNTVQFTGTGTYSDGSMQDVTTQATWASDTTGVVTISNIPGSRGLATASAAGTANITAVVGSITSANSTLTVQTVSESVLYSFGASGGSDGARPNGGLIQGSDGNFYGMTNLGGANSAGAVIMITPAGAESVLYSFGVAGGVDGNYPYGSLVQGSDGNFYGMTYSGGANDTGAVVRVTPAGAESVLYSFGPPGGSDGANPYGSLIQGSDGNLYGMTNLGGANGNGAVIKITLAGAESVLYSFGPPGGSDGANPYGSLIQGSDGNLYGMTNGGGANGNGAVIKITLAGVESVLYSFGVSGGGDGAMPSGSLIQGSDGNFYGMTYGGGANGSGAVIVLTPTGAETVLYSFGTSGGSDGAGPDGNLIQGSDGNFYGMTSGGGANGSGAAITISPLGTEAVLYSFGASGDGNYPAYGSLILASDGNFYGMTNLGGANNTGTVIKIN